MRLRPLVFACLALMVLCTFHQMEKSTPRSTYFHVKEIMNLVDRNVHNKTEIDECNGHNHDGEYHYHSTNSYPSFIGCFKARPYEANFRQKRASNSVCP